MPKSSERRRFPRLAIPEEARVFDENGRELGKVSHVSGSGMNLEDVPSDAARSLKPGQKIRVTVLEPGSRATNVLDVVVRGNDSGKLGIEFVNIVPDETPSS
jgi:hypothetical protein